MKAPLKKTIQNKFNDIHLPEDKLDTLMALQDNKKPANNRSNQDTKAFSLKILSLAALVLLSLSLFLVMPFHQGNIALKIANEVTHNHFKLKPLEIQSSVLADVSNYFTKLDFKPIPSDLLKNEYFTLLGARYCSLQGITAAQIRYQSASGELTTFYEVPYNEEIYSDIPNLDKGEEPLISYSKGIGVKIWVEKGILMAMTL